MKDKEQEIVPKLYNCIKVARIRRRSEYIHVVWTCTFNCLPITRYFLPWATKQPGNRVPGGGRQWRNNQGVILIVKFSVAVTEGLRITRVWPTMRLPSSIILPSWLRIPTAFGNCVPHP